MEPTSKTYKLKIHGMHCQSCEVLVEREFKAVAGVDGVRVNHATGKAVLYCSRQPDLTQLDALIKPHGYSLSRWGDPVHAMPAAEAGGTRRDYLHAGAVFLILFGLYLLLKQYDFLLPTFSFSDSMGYGLVFLIGLVAAASTCIAVTGGLLLAVAARYNEQRPHLTGAQKFRPHLYFNLGRILGYTAFGAGVGLLGSMLTISPRATGLLTIAASVVMVMLGLRLLKIFPWLSRLQPKMPKFIAHKIHDLSASQHPAGPAALGALTFFLPCGFTQALQLYVLTQGSWVKGALIMLVFALGTLPALLSLGVISSFAKGAFQRHFLKFAGALVVMLGIFNVRNGLTLAGVNVRVPGGVADGGAQAAALPDDPNVTFDGQQQVVKMDVVAFRYQPNHFTIRQNVPVRWEINGVNPYGCQSVLLVPALGITRFINLGQNLPIEFTPSAAGELLFHCSMGMYRGSFTVVQNAGAALAPASAPVLPAAPVDCDPTVSNCLQAQQLKMEISRARGFYPRSFTVKRGVPVVLAIDTQIPLGGCMSVMVIPEYNLAHRLTLGQSVARFTPTRTGTFPFTCSMGSPMGQIAVVN